MALPHVKEARRFQRSARERLDDARILLDAGRTTGATYLAGYAVECILKALILHNTPRRKRQEIRDSFTGSDAHNLQRLRNLYHRMGGPNLDPKVIRDFMIVTEWNTMWRYRSARVEPVDARGFIEAAGRLMQWAEGRF